MKKYFEFLLEFNRDDRRMLLSPEISQLFTVAFEFELETKEEKEIGDIDYQKNFKIVKSRIMKQITHEKFYDKNKNFIDDIFNSIEELIEDEDIDEIDNELLNEKRYKNKDEKIIIGIIFYEWTLYCNSELDYMQEQVKEHLPNFYKKYVHRLKFELDSTLQQGIEFSPKTYLRSINEGLEMIEDFFVEFDKQNYWIMNERTSIHINLGIVGKHKWNTIKGLLNINDIVIEERIPFAFKNIEYRIPIQYCQSLLLELKNELIIDQVKLNMNDPEIENFLNQKLLIILDEKGYKHFAFNLSHLQKLHYVEFRYIGGKINKEIIQEKLLFFAYITYLMTNPEYKKQEYKKKLYKFIDAVNSGNPKDIKLIKYKPLSID